MDATHYDLVSRVHVSPITCKWVIENFSTFYSNFPWSNNSENKIVSAPFGFGNTAATKGFFSIAHGYNKYVSYNKEVVLSLHVHSSFDQPVKFDFRLEILGSDDVFRRCVAILNDPTSSVRLYEWNHDVFRSKNYVKDGTLTLLFRLTFHNVTTSVSCEKKSETNGFGCILGDKEFSDVTFIAGDEEIPAHKALLVAKSPVFATMFKSKMKEEQTNRIEITEEADVFEELLRFIYTGNVENLDTNAEDLLAASDKYGIDQLKSLCELELVGQLNASNALQRLVLADLHRADHLQCKAIELINSQVSEVTKTPKCKSLIANLFAEIYSKFAIKSHND
jgi:BTB/POZ domain